MDPNYYTFDGEKACCPGCGNYGIHAMVKEALAELNLKKEEICFVSGIGQAAKSPQYYDVSYFNGLHGRALAAACGIKAAQPDLKVIVESGDGDMYGEGGNHFIHTIRRNPDITVLVHDNLIYGLTKGQASPTSLHGMITSIQVQGVTATPLNPLALALSAGASFVARGAAGAPELTREIIKRRFSTKVSRWLIFFMRPYRSTNTILTNGTKTTPHRSIKATLQPINSPPLSSACANFPGFWASSMMLKAKWSSKTRSSRTGRPGSRSTPANGISTCFKTSWTQKNNRQITNTLYARRNRLCRN